MWEFPCITAVWPLSILSLGCVNQLHLLMDSHLFNGCYPFVLILPATAGILTSGLESQDWTLQLLLSKSQKMLIPPYAPVGLQFRSMFAPSPLYLSNSPLHEHNKRGLVFHLINWAVHVRFLLWMGQEGPVMPESGGAQSVPKCFCRNSPSQNECNNS